MTTSPGKACLSPFLPLAVTRLSRRAEIGEFDQPLPLHQPQVGDLSAANTEPLAVLRPPVVPDKAPGFADRRHRPAALDSCDADEPAQIVPPITSTSKNSPRKLNRR